jgi:hypothetical protein
MDVRLAIVFGAAALFAAPICLAANDMAASLRALLIQYRCPIVDRLDRIYAVGDPSSARNRFLAVTVPEHRHGYVQCMFIERNTRLLCEASSGYYYSKEDLPRLFWLSPDAIAALARLGFSTDDSHGNFRIELDVSNPPDFNAIADFILLALHDGYDARASSQLQFNAPFAPRPTSKCIPVG